jgi:hypothetical protein
MQDILWITDVVPEFCYSNLGNNNRVCRQGVVIMLAHNHSVAVDFERQSRERIKRASDNSRLLRSNRTRAADRPQKNVKNPIFGLGWLKGLRLNPAN